MVARAVWAAPAPPVTPQVVAALALAVAAALAIIVPVDREG